MWAKKDKCVSETYVFTIPKGTTIETQKYLVLLKTIEGTSMLGGVSVVRI